MFDAVQLFAKALHELDKSQVVSAILNISRFDIFEQGCLLCHPLSMSFPLTFFIGVLLSRSWLKFEEVHVKIASSAWPASLFDPL